MTSIGSLLQAPEATQPLSIAPTQFSNIEEHGAQLLELRTEAGPVYICPSGLQRIRLQWVFRHFRVLPSEVLRQRDQRLIEELSHSAVVKPAFPVTSDNVFGVVEKTRSRPLAPPDRVFTPRTASASAQVFPPKTRISALPGPVAVQQVSMAAPRGPAKWDPGFHQWGALGALATVCFAVILASVYRILPTSQPLPMASYPTVDSSANRAVSAVKPAELHRAAPISLFVAPVTALLPNAAKPIRRIAPQTVEAAVPGQQATEAPQLPNAGRTSMLTPAALVPIAEAAPIASTPSPDRRFVSELPPGHFAHPVVSDPNLVGELQMKALIGTDGSVKEVTVLSGSPKLAAAGMRAVRQWHYNPYQVQGTPVEVETQIKMNFFGQDAVSIASVAKESASRP